MAVKFFRMSEKGTVKRPTLVAIGFTLASWVVAMFLLRNHPIICVLVAWPIEYLFFAVLLSSPFRVTLGKVMHWTRYHTIMSLPTPADKAWLDANHGVFKKTGLKMYLGENADKKTGNQGVSNQQGRTIKKVMKKVKVIYEDDRPS